MVATPLAILLQPASQPAAHQMLVPSVRSTSLRPNPTSKVSEIPLSLGAQLLLKLCILAGGLAAFICWLAYRLNYFLLEASHPTGETHAEFLKARGQDPQMSQD